MKKTKLFLILAMLCIGIGIKAQSFMSQSLTFTKPMYFFMFGDNKVKMDPQKNKCTLRFNKFQNRYITYEVEMEGAEVAEIAKVVGNPDGKLHFTWTGDTQRSINAMTQSQGGKQMYMVASGTAKLDGMVAQDDSGYMVVVTKQIEKNCITDIWYGMTQSEIGDKLKAKLGRLVKFDETGTEGDLKIMTVYGTRLQDDAVRSDLTHVKKDDPYAVFYFDANGKLAKWYMLKQ